MPANGSGRVEAVARAVRPTRAGYRFEDTYGKRSVGPSTGGAPASGATPAHHPRRPAHAAQQRVGDELADPPRLSNDRGLALELASRATSASRHSDAVAFRYYNNRRTSITGHGGGAVAPSARHAGAGRTPNGRDRNGSGLSQRRLRRHEQLMLYKVDAAPSISGRQSMRIDDSEEDEATAQPLDVVDRLELDERQVCELLVCMLLHKPPLAAQSILRALAERVEARRMLRHYAGLRGSPVANADGQTPTSEGNYADNSATLEAMSAADKAVLIATLQERQRELRRATGAAAEKGGDDAAVAVARERRRCEWVQRQMRHKAPRVPALSAAAGQTSRPHGESQSRKTPSQPAAATSAVAAAIAVRALRASGRPAASAAQSDAGAGQAATTANTPCRGTPASLEPRVSSATPLNKHADDTSATAANALPRRRNGAGPPPLPPPLSRASLAAEVHLQEQQHEQLPAMRELLPQLDERRLSPGAAAARRAYLESHPHANGSREPSTRPPAQKPVAPVVRKVLPNLLEASTCSLDKAAEQPASVERSSELRSPGRSNADQSHGSEVDDDTNEDAAVPILSCDDAELVRSKDASLLSVNSGTAPPQLNVTAAPRRTSQPQAKDGQPRRGVGAMATRSPRSVNASHVAQVEHATKTEGHAAVAHCDERDGPERSPSLPSGQPSVVPAAPCTRHGEAGSATPQAEPHETIESVMITATSAINETTTTTIDGDGGATVVVTASQLSPIEAKAVAPSQNNSLRSDEDSFKLPWED